jgi:hypothetical protein
VGEDSKLESVSKLLAGTGVAAGATLFTITGFLAARAYLVALGIPEHATLAVNEYLQYGGRIIFVLTLQLAPIMALLLLLIAPILGYANKLAQGPRQRVLLYLAVIVVAAICIDLEFSLLALSDPVFSTGRVHTPDGARRLQLLAAEIMTALMVLALSKWGAQFWRETRTSPARKALILAMFLLTGTQLCMLPLCFGQVSMIPSAFDRVILLREKDQPSVQGALVFSDSSAHFVFTPDKNLVEVPRAAIREIHYVGRATLEDLAR